MENLLYIEIDIICIVLIGIVFFQISRNVDKSVSQRRLLSVNGCLILFYLTDLLWFCLQEGIIPFSLGFGWGINIFYFIFLAATGYLWFVYSETIQRNPHMSSRRWALIWFIPAFLVIALCVSSIWTGWLFTLSDSGAYSRGPLYIIQPILLYLYAFVTAIKALVKSARTDNYSDRRKFNTLASFVVLPIIGGAAQVLVFGLDFLYPAIALSMLWVYIDLQSQQISIDPLTQVNNRSQLFKQLNARMRDESDTLYLMMIDADDFKKINDSYGHTAGDEALVRIANALKMAAAGRNCFIARYGGDEFIAICKAVNDIDVEQLKEAVYEKLGTLNDKAGTDYRAEVSIGYTKWHPSMKSMQELIEEADANLYKEKSMRKAR